MPDVVINLFVYGTLMPDLPNFRQIEDLVIDYQPGTTDGVLVDLGAFPALVPGDGVVRGVVLDVDRRALEITDRIEGYHPDRDHCLYLRREVTVVLKTGESVPAWTYFFADPDRIADHPRLVVDETDGIATFAWESEER